MSNLSGANIGLNFKGLLNLGSTINTPLSATLQAITDGDGIASPLFLSTNEVSVRGTTNAQRLIIDANAGVGKLLSFRSGNLQRWAIRVDGTESGANAGADIAIRRYDDAGTFIDAPITLTRSTGFITLGKRVSYTGSTGTSLLNFPDAGTTAADGISFGTNISLFRTASEALRLNSTTFELFSPTNNRVSHWFSSGGRLRLINNIGEGTVFFDFDSAEGISSIDYGNNSFILKGGNENKFEISAISGQVNITPTKLLESEGTSALSISQIWDTTGNPTAIFLNIQYRASGETSNLMDLQVDKVSRFRVNKVGNITTNKFAISLDATTEADGNIILSNSGGDSFGMLKFGQATNLFPSIKINETNLDFRLADDSDFCGVSAKYFSGGGLILGNSHPRLYTGDGEVSANMYFTEETVGISNGLISPTNTTAILELTSTTKGFLPPRMTTEQRDLIATPAEGLMIYNTSTNRPNFFNGTSWVHF